MVQDVVAKKIDSVIFTSAPAVSNLLEVASMNEKKLSLLESFRHDVVPACIGTVTSAPLSLEGILPMLPPKARLGIFIKYIAYNLPSFHANRPLVVDSDNVEIINN